MAYTFDPATNRIILPRGDTATINVTVGGSAASDGDAVVWGLYSKQDSRWVVRRTAIIADGSASVRLSNADTRGLACGDKYGWSMSIVTDPAMIDGSASVDEDSDNVWTVYNGLQPFTLTESGVMSDD